jgi:biopolymer transport protein ExbD
MAQFKKNKKRESGAISTASLPDIVFMLLFFFMVATVLRTEEEMVRVVRPEASELYRIEKKHLIRYINIGPPQDARRGTEPVIQLNDAFASAADVQEWVENERLTINEAEQSKMWVSLKVDKETKMGIVTDVKQELRKASALKVLYSAGRRDRTASAN